MSYILTNYIVSYSLLKCISLFRKQRLMFDEMVRTEVRNTFTAVEFRTVRTQYTLHVSYHYGYWINGRLRLTTFVHWFHTECVRAKGKKWHEKKKKFKISAFLWNNSSSMNLLFLYGGELSICNLISQSVLKSPV